MRRTTLALTLSVFTLLPSAVPALAASCPFPMVRECQPPPKDRPQAVPMPCRCVNPPGSPTWGGKAEIHKKNVPTVKPNKQPGPNN
jgi:hypothetical protein